MVAATGPGIRPLTFRLTSPPTAATLSANALEPSSVAAAGREIEIVALRLPEGNLRRHLGDARAALARSDRDVGALDEEVNRLAHDQIGRAHV